jgi:hypothetical protein
VTDRPARLVLDTSAVAAWARGSVSVGELLAEIDLEYGAVIIPLPCLIEAAANLVDGKDLLDLLVEHTASVVLADDPGDWRMLAGVLAVVGNHALASAAWNALDLGVDVLTRHPGRYAGLAGGGMVLPFDD